MLWKICLAKVKQHKVDQRRTWLRCVARNDSRSTGVRATGNCQPWDFTCLGRAVRPTETFSRWEIQWSCTRDLRAGAKCVFRVLPCVCILFLFRVSHDGIEENCSWYGALFLFLSLSLSLSLPLYLSICFFHGYRSWQQTAAATTTTTVAVAINVVKCNRNGHVRGKKTSFSHPGKSVSS